MPKEEPRGFSYKKRTKESLKERANMKGGNYDTTFKPKFTQWKPKDGKNLIRILPPTWDPEDAPWQSTEHYGLDIFINYNIGADNSQYLSLSKHGKGEDPIAEAKREAQAEGEKEFAKKLNPTQRILYWIIDRTDEGAGPLLWAAPFTFDKALSNLCIDEDTKDVIFIDDPEKGRDIRFYREGTGLNTTYDASKMKVLPASLIYEDEVIEEEWLNFIYENPLPSVLNFYEYDHIKSAFDGKIGIFDEDGDDAPVRGKKRTAAAEENDKGRDPPRRATRTTEPDPEPDPEPEQEPLARSRRARPVVEDEPPPPSRSRRGRSEPEPEADPEEDNDPVDESVGRGGSLREKLAARRRSRTPVDDD